MKNQSNLGQIFKSSVALLCNSVGKDGIRKLDSILVKNDPDEEVLINIFTAFPQFKNIFIQQLKKYSYDSN
jgi:hypothetical protein